ncbi:MAG: hypothetical protein AB7D37_10935 [Desulfovibrio sp.]
MTAYKPVAIHPTPLCVNSFRDGKRQWRVTSLIERAKDLEPFDLPLVALFSGSRVFDPIESAYALAEHMKRALAADMNFPIILDAEGFVMDGWHRITRALVEGRATIKAVRFDETPPCDFVESE